MKAFVTGATGLLGSNLVSTLLAEGHDVVGLARSPEKARRLFPDGASSRLHWVTGDMEDVEGFAAHLRGAEVLFHTAAYFRESFDRGEHWEALKRINVDGTVRLLEAADAVGVSKTIYVSSSNVLGAYPDGRPSDESCAPDAFSHENLYSRSKVLAEEAVNRFLETHRMPVVQVLPTAIFGPQDAAPTASGQFIIDFMDGKTPAIPPGGFSVVDARDAAAAMVAAADRGRSGERYILSDRFYSAAEILNLVAKSAGMSTPRIVMPDGVAVLFAQLSELVAGLRGTKPLAPVSAIRILTARRKATAAKAERELGFRPRPFSETIADTVRWFADHGYAKIHANPTGAIRSAV